MIDADLKRCLGQMAKEIQVVSAARGATVRASCSHRVCQVSFAAPILVASVSPKHDAYPRVASEPAREPGTSVRDVWLARVAEQDT